MSRVCVRWGPAASSCTTCGGTEPTLSGFLLYRPFAAALLRARPRPDLAAYLRNRALRILPAYGPSY